MDDCEISRPTFVPAIFILGVFAVIVGALVWLFFVAPYVDDFAPRAVPPTVVPVTEAEVEGKYQELVDAVLEGNQEAALAAARWLETHRANMDFIEEGIAEEVCGWCREAEEDNGDSFVVCRLCPAY